MENLTELKQEIVQRLTQSGAFSEVDIVEAYELRCREYPITRSVIAVGVEAVELTPGGLGGYYGEREQQPLYGGGARVSLRFDLYAPQAEGSGRLHGLYESLCDILMLRGNTLHIEKMWCGDVIHEASDAALHLAARATLHTVILRGEDEDPAAIGQVRFVYRRPDEA